MSKFKDYNAVCTTIGRDPQALPGTEGLRPKDATRILIDFKWSGIVEAYNEGWEADWTNSDQYKYQPVAVMDPSGFGLDVVDCYYTLSDVPSRLCFKSRQAAKDAVADFPEEFKEYMLN